MSWSLNTPSLQKFYARMERHSPDERSVVREWLISAGEMLLDFPDWKLGQILVDFGDDAVFHVGVKGVAQLRERARRSNDDDRLDPFRAHQLLQGGSDALGKALLLQLVPIRRLHAAALVLGGALEDPPGAIGTLVVGRLIFIGEHALGGQIHQSRVAGIAQEQCLLPVAD